MISSVIIQSEPARSRGQSAEAEVHESRMEMKDVISKWQLCPLLFLKMRKIIQNSPCGIFCCCSDFIQIPGILLLLETLDLSESKWTNSIRTQIPSEHSISCSEPIHKFTVKCDKCRQRETQGLGKAG